MNTFIRKPGKFKLIFGIILTVAGLSGVGYVPGKPLYFTLISVVIAVCGAATLLIYREDMRLYRQKVRRLRRMRAQRAA